MEPHTTSSQPVMTCVISWTLLLPIMYYASQGAFWFERPDQNSKLAATYGSLASTGASGEKALVRAAVYAVIAILLSPLAKLVIADFMRERVFALLCLLALVSSTWSHVPMLSARLALCLTIETLFAFYLCRRFTPERQIELMMLAGWLSLTTCIVMSLLFPVYGIANVADVGAWKGIYFHKNFCALTTVLFLPAVFFIDSKSPIGHLARAAYFILSIAVIGMTRSRTGWLLAFSVIICVIFVKSVRNLCLRDRRILLFWGVVAFLVLACVAVLLSDSLAVLLGKDPTFTGRTGIWQAAIQAILRRPVFGYGYMGFWRGFEGDSESASLVNRWAVTSSHNAFIETWLTLGAAGLALLLFLFYRSFRCCWICLVSRRAPYVGWYASIVLLTFLAAVDEQQVLMPSNLAWLIFIVASVGLSNATRVVRVEGIRDEKRIRSDVRAA
jgi:exopolysaccharide production protein ExoQ